MRYRNRLILLLIQLILVLAIGSSRASAANLYVSTSGNDNNPGTLDQPVKDVVTKLPGTATSFLWTVPRGKTRTGRIRVTVSNAGGVQGQGESSGDFTVKKAKPSA